MATQGQQIRETFVAGEDLSESQFRFVTAGADYKVAKTGAGNAADGVVINDPDDEGAATVVTYGRVIVEAGGSVDANHEIASDADGKAVTATSGDIVLGKVVEDGVDGQLVTVDFYKGGNEVD